MPDITVQRHGDRWAVAEPGAASPSKEFPTRAAAELAARDLAAGGSVHVVEDDPSGLERSVPENAGESERVDSGGPRGVGAEEGVRERQAGL